MTAFISLQGVTKGYVRDGVRVDVLDDVWLDIGEGEFLAVMGPSGSGKTTILNIIAGIDRPDRGTVSVAGSQLHDMAPSALAQWRSDHLGYVFQFYNLLPALTAEQNVEVPLLLKGLSAAARKKNVSNALELVGLTDRAKHRPSEMSGGQQQRVAIARAIIADPMLLVCDEPTGDLDRESSDSILELLKILNFEHRKTIVMVTHDPESARFASRQLHFEKRRFSGDSASSLRAQAAGMQGS
jgi:putative ABC transport system ATP-binding protein